MSIKDIFKSLYGQPKEIDGEVNKPNLGQLAVISYSSQLYDQFICKFSSGDKIIESYRDRRAADLESKPVAYTGETDKDLTVCYLVLLNELLTSVEVEIGRVKND